MVKARFEWDEFKNLQNQARHGVSFEEAQYVFLDEKRILAKDEGHSKEEERFYCIGQDLEGVDILTVRFTHRKGANSNNRGGILAQREKSLCPKKWTTKTNH